MGYCYGAPIETTVQTSDQLQLYSTVQGQPRRASVSALADALETLHPTPDALIDIATYYVMRGASSSAVALTTTPAPFNATQFSSPSFSIPSVQTSLSYDTANGRFVAVRDIQAIEFSAAVLGDWPTNRDLRLAVQVGDPTNFYTSPYQYIAAGGGAGVARAGLLAGVVTNINDSQGIIRAGQVIRLVASMSTADTLNLTGLQFSVKPLDGV